jgi:hypothetical protein
MTKSTNNDNFFLRVKYVVDKHYDGNQSAFARDMGIKRQYVNKWYQEYDKKDKQPNPGQDILSSIVSGLLRNTEVNPLWFITGRGPKTNEQDVQKVSEKFSDYEASLSDLDNVDISEDDFLQFVLKQQEAVLNFLRTLKKSHSPD